MEILIGSLSFLVLIVVTPFALGIALGLMSCLGAAGFYLMDLGFNLVFKLFGCDRGHGGNDF